MTSSESAPFPSDCDLVGTWRRFGPTGPVYEVLKRSADPRSVEIRVLETGEVLDYEINQAARDPRED